MLFGFIALSGCSTEGVQSISESDFSESNSTTDITIDTSDASDISDTSESTDALVDNPDTPNDNTDDTVICEKPIKCSNHSIDSKGILLNDLKQAQEHYLIAMDNNCFYFSLGKHGMEQIISVDKNDFSVEQDVLDYKYSIEYGWSTSKRTYCGHYVAFPCLGSVYDVTLNAWVGKSGEEQKCILEQPTGAITICAAEVSDDEIVFLCTGELKGIFNIYRYNFAEEKAQLIYTEILDEASQNSNPLITCCNGDIYFIYRSAENKTDYCIKQLDTDGNVCDEMHLSLPEDYDTSMGEFTVTENNFLIRFFPEDDFGYFQTVLVNRETEEISSDSGYNKLGVRFNDGMIDDRYIIYRAGSELVPDHPMICVFDDWNSEFNFIEFTEIDSSGIINTVADSNGDIVFFTHDGDVRFVTMYENVVGFLNDYI